MIIIKNYTSIPSLPCLGRRLQTVDHLTQGCLGPHSLGLKRIYHPSFPSPCHKPLDICDSHLAPRVELELGPMPPARTPAPVQVLHRQLPSKSTVHSFHRSVIVVVPRDKRCVGGCSSELSMAVGAGGPAAAGRGGGCGSWTPRLPGVKVKAPQQKLVTT